MKIHQVHRCHRSILMDSNYFQKKHNSSLSSSFNVILPNDIFPGCGLHCVFFYTTWLLVTFCILNWLCDDQFEQSGWSRFQLTLCEGGIFWTGFQSITGLKIQQQPSTRSIHTQRQFSQQLTWCVCRWSVGEIGNEKPTQAQGEHAHSIQKSSKQVWTSKNK